MNHHIDENDKRIIFNEQITFSGQTQKGIEVVGFWGPGITICRHKVGA